MQSAVCQSECGTHSKQQDVSVGVHAEGSLSAAVLLQEHTAGTPAALIHQERWGEQQQHNKQYYSFKLC